MRIRYYTDGEYNASSAAIVDALEKIVSAFFSQFLARGIELQIDYPDCKGESAFAPGSLTLWFPEAGIDEENDLFEASGERAKLDVQNVELELKLALQRLLLSIGESDTSGDCRPEG